MNPPNTPSYIPQAGTIFSEQRFEPGTARLPVIRTLSCGLREPGFFFPGESHQEAELLYLERGQLHTVIDGAEALLEPGELILCAPHRWHSYFADPGEPPLLLSLTFHCDPPLPQGLFGRKRTISPAVERFLGLLLREVQSPDRFSPDMIPLVLMQLLTALQRQEEAGDDVPAIPNENEIILRAQRYIAGQVRHRLSVPLVARNVSVSPSYLTALFHKHLRIAPAEYIRRAKLQESKRLIRESGMTFTEIAAALQYSTVHHFSRQFKEKFGITPTEYAKAVGTILTCE